MDGGTEGDGARERASEEARERERSNTFRSPDADARVPPKTPSYSRPSRLCASLWRR